MRSNLAILGSDIVANHDEVRHWKPLDLPGPERHYGYLSVLATPHQHANANANPPARGDYTVTDRQTDRYHVHPSVLENSMDPDTAASPPDTKPPLINYIVSFLLVGVAWGFTTPFIRRAATDFNARQEARQSSSRPAHGLIRTDHGHGHEHGHEQSGDETELVAREGSGSDSDEESETEADAGSERGDCDGPGNAPTSTPPTPAWMNSQQPRGEGWLRTKVATLFWTIVNLLRTPAYLVPLVINLTGSVWFFLLVGKHGSFPAWFCVKEN